MQGGGESSHENVSQRNAQEPSPSFGALFLGAFSRLGTFFSGVFGWLSSGAQSLWTSLKRVADFRGWTNLKDRKKSALQTQLELEYSRLAIAQPLSFNHQLQPLELLFLSRLEAHNTKNLEEVDYFLSKELLKNVTHLDFSHIILSSQQSSFNEAMLSLLKKNQHITSITFHADDLVRMDGAIQEQLNNNKCWVACDTLLSQDTWNTEYNREQIEVLKNSLSHDVSVRKFSEATPFSVLEVTSEKFNPNRREDVRRQALRAAYDALIQALTHDNSGIEECQDEFICAHAGCDVRKITLPIALLNNVKPDTNTFIERFLALNLFIVDIVREDNQPLTPSACQLLKERQMRRMSLHLINAGANGDSTVKLNSWNSSCIMKESAEFNRLTQNSLSNEKKESNVRELSSSLISKFRHVFSQLTEKLNTYLAFFRPLQQQTDSQERNENVSANSVERINQLMREEQYKNNDAERKPSALGESVSQEEVNEIGRDLGIDFPFDNVELEQKQVFEVERLFDLINACDPSRNAEQEYHRLAPDILYKGLLGRKNIQYSEDLDERTQQLVTEVLSMERLIDDPLKLCTIKQFIVHPDKFPNQNQTLKDKAEIVSKFINGMKKWLAEKDDRASLWPQAKEEAKYTIAIFKLAQHSYIREEKINQITITRKTYKEDMDKVYAQMHRQIGGVIKSHQNSAQYYQGNAQHYQGDAQYYQGNAQHYQGDAQYYQGNAQTMDSFTQEVMEFGSGYQKEKITFSGIRQKLQNKEPLTDEEMQIAQIVQQKQNIKSQENGVVTQQARNESVRYGLGAGYFSVPDGASIRKSVSDSSIVLVENSQSDRASSPAHST